MAIKEVNKSNFEEIINRDKKVLADFNADWCGPCRMLKPILEEIAEENDDFEIISINIDNEEELALKYNVLSIPCLIIFDKGNEVKRNIGLISKDDILKMIGEK